MANACPRCPSSPLRRAQGALHEDVCATCQGRYLDGDTLLSLCERHLRIGGDIVRELSQSGPRRLICPGCRQKMTLTMMRGVQVDLCGGCGGAWLDAGELSSLTRGGVNEVAPSSSSSSSSSSVLSEAQALFGGGAGAAAGASVDGTVDVVIGTAVAPLATRPRFGVVCTNCDVELSLSQDNWMINGYPWCPTCARPHTSLWAHVVGAIGAVFGNIVAVFAPFVRYRRRFESYSEARQRRRQQWSDVVDNVAGPANDDFGPDFSSRVDAYRVVPADAEQHFARFFRVMRS